MIKLNMNLFLHKNLKKIKINWMAVMENYIFMYKII